MSEKESQFGALKWLKEIGSDGKVSKEKTQGLNELSGRLASFLGLNCDSADEVIKLDYTVLGLKEIISAGTTALSAQHYDDDRALAEKDERYLPFREAIAKYQVTLFLASIRTTVRSEFDPLELSLQNRVIVHKISITLTLIHLVNNDFLCPQFFREPDGTIEHLEREGRLLAKFKDSYHPSARPIFEKAAVPVITSPKFSSSSSSSSSSLSHCFPPNLSTKPQVISSEICETILLLSSGEFILIIIPSY